MALKRRRSSNRWLGITQIILLTAALVMILFFRDMIASGASEFVGIFGDDDIRVQAPADPDEKTSDQKRLDEKPIDIKLDVDLKVKPDADSAESVE